MTKQAADRFAEALLRQNGKERMFQFELPAGHNLEFVTAALREAGCEVSIGPNASVIVKPPSEPISR